MEPARDSGAAGKIVAGLVRKARAAQKIFERSTQQQLDDAVLAVGWAIMNPGHNQALAKLAVQD
ncbi:MAG: acylating sulfoacetaldehyde dehydrogenase, partial [Burkholderiales bacterium]